MLGFPFLFFPQQIYVEPKRNEAGSVEPLLLPRAALSVPHDEVKCNRYSLPYLNFLCKTDLAKAKLFIWTPSPRNLC